MAFRLLLPKYARSPLPSFPLAPDTQGLGYCDLFRGRVGRDGKPSAHGCSPRDKANYRAANGSAGAGVGSRPSSHNSGYVIWANSSALILRLVWQSSLATLPFCR